MKKVILGISSSIAAYKACDLVRLFVKSGHSVYPVLTKNAAKLITPLTLENLSGNPVYSDTFVEEKREMGHIELKEEASLFLVAPATANIIGKFAGGIADDLLSTTFLSVDCPVVIAPAMNPNMWNHPAVQENIKRLKSWGAVFVDPDTGQVACGDEGKGRLADVDKIYKVAISAIKK
ncbi:MAG: phosphopantothenoylcysteine decarboxylase [bacterium]|nr:phosphopantothenoylcysteine decarboxylase [bacterium]